MEGLVRCKITPPLCKRLDENGHITHKYLQQKLIDVYEKEHKKKKEWENWFDKQKKIITEDLEYKKNQWLQESEHSWEEYIWLLWFKKKGLDYLKKDYQKWLKSRLTDYNKLMKKTLLQHNTKYQEEWCTLPGKAEVADYWNKWYMWGLQSDVNYPLISRKYCLWLGRTTGEKNEWTKFIQGSGKTYMGEKCPSLQDFLSEKNDFFRHWLVDFFKKWVECRQWRVWLQERKDSIKARKGKKAN
ncbi:tryptophan-rich antigen [Plasmodium ovale wallikeri]|uniref:Tryptophan-rich antigen n=1 Tax=Plasmodium ovale wallikeri TaxID=864142 RepID=A0A1A9AI36_PLAOA|nr:tryptophan-rich antigen [Plasmodium ovale wallikeri]